MDHTVHPRGALDYDYLADNRAMLGKCRPQAYTISHNRYHG